VILYWIFPVESRTHAPMRPPHPFLPPSLPCDMTKNSLGRTHINSCDFSVRSYSFDDVEDDYDLDEFDTNVVHDVDVGMVDMMLLAARKVESSYPKEHSMGYGMRILASPWSPPSWMKTPTLNDVPGAVHAMNMTGSYSERVCIRDGVDEKSAYARSWALYFSKFISACEFVIPPSWLSFFIPSRVRRSSLLSDHSHA
jgi:glucosylceramidase